MHLYRITAVTDLLQIGKNMFLRNSGGGWAKPRISGFTQKEIS
jgi:hypothetical protein